MTDGSQPIYGPDGEPCTSCAAPLAGDQRYCLNCGTRRPEAVLPFLDGLSGGEAQLVPYGQPLPGTPVAAIAPPPTLNDRLRANSPLMGLVGILLLALLIGVLLGHWAGDDSSAAAAAPAAPQVISVGGGAAAPAAAPAATTSTSPSETTSTDDGSGGDAGTSGASGSSSSSSKKAAPVKKAAPAVKKLNTLSGKDYQKAVDKLPKSFSTGGKAPPVDKTKPVGGGSSSEEIG